jgi:hypothetical protein
MQPNQFGSNPFSTQDKIRPIKQSGGMGNPFDSYRSKKDDFNSPEGLYNLAQEAGLGEQADKMVQRAGGEDQKFFSGGFVMDVMDVLNIGSYGVVGMVKGKTFAEGVKNRESLSDEDALGKYGFAGKMAGFIGDILLDPFTYIAPWKTVSKIPGIVKTVDEARRMAFGDLIKIEVDGQKTFERVGGWTPLKAIPDKLMYGFAVDKTYLNGMEQVAGRNDTILGESEELISGVLDRLQPDLFNKTLSKDADGRIISRNLDEIQRDLNPEQFESVKSLYTLRDSLMDKLVSLGAITEETKDKHWGTYLKQTYDEYLEKKGTLPGGKSGVRMDKSKRKAGLTEDVMKELGQVEDAAVVWGQTLLKQIKMVKDAELIKYTADGYAMTDDLIPEFIAKGGKMENLHRVTDASYYALDGKAISISKKVKDLNSVIKNIRKERLAAGADELELERTLGGIEKELDRLKGATEDELSEAWSGVRQILRDSSITQGPMKKQATSAGQKIVAAPLVKWLNRGSKSDRLARETMTSEDLWKQFMDTKDGYAVQRAFEDPRMMYQWNSPVEFLDSLRYPDKATVFKSDVNRLDELSDTVANNKIVKAEKDVRKIGKLEQEYKVLSETNLKMVQEAVDRIETEFADALWKKSNLLKDLEKAKYGGLAGKYVSKEIWDVLKGQFEPSDEIGQGLVMWFKSVKTIWNPASHVRNAMSATVQNWWKLGIGPWRMDVYYESLKEFKTGGRHLNEMKSMGFNERSGIMGELMDNYLLNKGLVGESYVKQLGGVKQARKFVKHLDKKMKNAYGHTDNIAKLAGYKYGLSQGLSKEDAYAQAMAATFNYSQVTPLVQKLRKNLFGAPFITFSLKAVPLVAETIINNPGRISVFGKIRNSLFDAAGIQGQQESEAMPDYMRDDQFVMRLPWKDEQGRSMYFDLSYIIPFGDIASGKFLSDPVAAFPVLRLMNELATNETFSGSKIFRESDDLPQVVADITLHTLKLGLPPSVVDTLSDGYGSDGQRREPALGWQDLAGTDTDDLGPGERNYYQKMFKYAGLGAIPYELNSKEASLAYTQKENLSKLLTENGVTKTFTSNYLPKDSEYRDEPQKIYDREVSPLGR